MVMTEFEIKNKLFTMVHYSVGAYKTAFAFVGAVKDNQEELQNRSVVYEQAFRESSTNSGGVDAQAASAVILARSRWDTMYPVSNK